MTILCFFIPLTILGGMYLIEKIDLLIVLPHDLQYLRAIFKNRPKQDFLLIILKLQ